MLSVKLTFEQRAASVEVGSLPPNASAAPGPARASQERLLAEMAKTLTLQHFIQRAAVFVSAAVIHVKSGEI